MRRAPAAAVLVALTASVASADGPTLFGGRLVFGGEASAAVAASDPGFFDYTDYERSALRVGRLALSASFRASDRVWLLGEARSEDLSAPEAYALYLRLRPWPGRRFDVQAGLIPPAFGAFARRSYGSDNFLIGIPLAYQYLTSVRPDAAPATAADLLRMRGRGWLASYPIGSAYPERGLPLASALRWDTGVQARAGSEKVEVVAAVTTGTLSNPRVFTRDDNSGRQLSGRVAARPVTGLVLGASFARGPYLSADLERALPAGSGRGRSQTAWGADIEYSRGYWLGRAEAVFSGWDMPTLDTTLRARAVSVEGRYKLRPGLYAAARFDDLGFGRMLGVTWDAPVRRLEAGAGWQIRRYLLLKAVFQANRRDGGRVSSYRTGAAQLLYWF